MEELIHAAEEAKICSVCMINSAGCDEAGLKKQL